MSITKGSSVEMEMQASRNVVRGGLCHPFLVYSSAYIKTGVKFDIGKKGMGEDREVQ